jgi:hypothetical protein
MMGLKFRWWGLLVGLLGIAVSAIGMIRESQVYARIERMGPNAIEDFYHPSWDNHLMVFMGSAMVFLSLIGISKNKMLSKAATFIVIILAVPAVLMILFYGADIRVLKGCAAIATVTVMLGSCMLFVGAIAAAAIALLSWIKKRNQKLPSD